MTKHLCFQEGYRISFLPTPMFDEIAMQGVTMVTYWIGCYRFFLVDCAPEQRIEFQPFCRHTHNTVVKKVNKYILRNVTFLKSVGGIETTFNILKNR